MSELFKILIVLISSLIFATSAFSSIGYFWHITDFHYDALYEANGNPKQHCWRDQGGGVGSSGSVSNSVSNSVGGGVSGNNGVSNNGGGRRGSSGSGGNSGGVGSSSSSGGSGGNNNRRRGVGLYGDYACDSPWALIESAGKAMRLRQGDNIEFVLWTGDALSHSHAKLSEARRLVLLQNVTDLLHRTFSSQFVFPVVGHDDPATVSQLADLWRRWLPPEAMQTFIKGGYYTIEQKERKLRIIILNTNLWVAKEPSYNNGGLSNNGYSSVSGINTAALNYDTLASIDSHYEEEGKLQWDWLESVLSKSYQNRETVYLVGHIPPGSNERQMGAIPLAHQGYTRKNNERYLNMVRRHHKTIVGQFFGHLHSDTFRIIYNKQGNPISWIMMAPALTPRRVNGAANNPGLRLYKFDTDTGQVLDYIQYYLDLQQANYEMDDDGTDSNEKFGWLPEYNLTSWYNLNQITPLTLHNLADKFTQKVPEENIAFSKYFIANSVSIYKSPLDGNCEVSCAHTHFCAITRVNYDEYQQCIKTAASALSSQAPNNAQLYYLINNKKFQLISLFTIIFIQHTIEQILFSR